MVRMEYLALCGSDLRFYDRTLSAERYPLKVGSPCHECVGTVEESTDPALPSGQRVIAVTSQGALVEYAAVSSDLLVPVPDGAKDPSLWVLCQPVGTVIYALQRLGSVYGKRVAVVGQGPIGLAFTDLLVRNGAREVYATDVNDDRLAVARGLGAIHTINVNRENPVERIAELTHGEMVDIGIEACGLSSTYHQVFSVLRKLGTVVIFGMPHVEDVFAFDWSMAYSKLPTILVTNSAAAGERVEYVSRCVDLVAEGRLDLSYLVSHRFSWSDIPQAFSMYSTRTDRSLKGIITVQC